MSDGTRSTLSGLRERKKEITRATIQSTALRLFQERGYDATTVEDITTAAEISEATFYRYFPSKSDLVLINDCRIRFIDAFLAQPPQVGTWHAMRAAVLSELDRLAESENTGLRERMAIALVVPELRAALLALTVESTERLAAAAAERVGRPPTDFAVRAMVGAVAGVCVTVMHVLVDNPSANITSLVDEAIAFLETGFAL